MVTRWGDVDARSVVTAVAARRFGGWSGRWGAGWVPLAAWFSDPALGSGGGWAHVRALAIMVGGVPVPVRWAGRAVV
ncbi:hypothetical protein GCM10022254_35860 [Actinomadura meridiana]|uniref:Uncharacterized protein n=1 Tax=Actinomadura meridiana TaxID=559626 RepID=A0ABP8C529_9ACTN